MSRLCALAAAALVSFGVAGIANAAKGDKASKATKAARLANAANATNTVSTGPAADADAELPGEILVKLRSTAALQPLLARYPVTLVSRFGARPIYRLKALDPARTSELLASLTLEPEVMIAETNPQQRSPEARRNMPWAIGTVVAWATQWAPQAMRLGQAQLLSLGAGVRVAVLDTGVDRNHPLLAGRLLPGYDFVDGDADPSEVRGATAGAWGHGTHVSGLVASVAPAARILPLRVLDVDGVGNAWVLAEALLYALDPDGNPATNDGAHVINLSLGSLSRTRIMDTIAQIATCTPALPGDAIGDRSDPGYLDDERRCANGSNGALVVAAAGNDGSASIKAYPAAEGAYGLLSVAASTSDRRLASFSNSGSWINMAAPGEGITSAIPGGWATWSGTSMAAPLVAATGALVRARDLRVTPKDVARRLERSASALCGTDLRQVDALAAVVNIDQRASNCR